MIQYWVLVFIIGSTVSLPTENIVTTGKFSTNFFYRITQSLIKMENFVISPASAHTLLGLTYYGTEGQTAKEIENVLHLPSSNKEEIANIYFNLLKSTHGSHPLIKMANKIYIKEGLSITPHFNEIARDSFELETEYINFEDSDAAVNTINEWVEKQTNNKIKNILNYLEKSSKIILVNAIHFNREWKVTPSVVESVFLKGTDYLKTTEFLKVKDDFKYGKFPKLDAVAAELPYKNSNLSLMIILPNFDSSLNCLETKLETVNLLDLSKEMTGGETKIMIPKFQVTTNLHMSAIWKLMGIYNLFTENAEFNFINSAEKVEVTDVIVKTFIDVNEKSTEGTTVPDLRADHYNEFIGVAERALIANRPFVFAIKDDRNIYFAGHLRHIY